MELSLRILREGRAEPGAPAPLLVLRHSLAAAGGAVLLRHALSELAAAVASGRAQAAALLVVALERPAAAYPQQVTTLPTPSLAVLDGFTDAHGWGSLLGPCGSGSSGTDSSGSAAPASTVVRLPGLLAAAGGMQQLQTAVAAALAGLAQPVAVIFDSLSPLVDAAGAPAVAQLLHSLAAHPAASCLLAGLHADLHAAHEVGALEALAAGTLAATLERRVCAAAAGGAAPQGRLTARLRRRSGRVRCEVRLYRVTASGAVTFMEPPAEPAAGAPAAAAAADTAAAAAAAAAAGPLASQMAGGMKLGLSAEEEEARRRVQLPFEHQGQRDAYQAGDWRDYLPPEAGGRGLPGHGASVAAAAAGGRLQQQQQHQQAAAGPATTAAPAAAAAGGTAARQHQQAASLGRILYVRDSGSEADSDEDPDDDLDI